jgi:hypothetical protein
LREHALERDDDDRGQDALREKELGKQRAWKYDS